MSEAALRPLPRPRAVAARARGVLEAAGFHGFGVYESAVKLTTVCVRRGDDPARYVAALEADNIWRARYILYRGIDLDMIFISPKGDG